MSSKERRLCWQGTRLIIFSLILLIISFCLSGLALADDTVTTNIPDEIMLSWTGNPQTTQTICWRNADTVSNGEVEYLAQEDYDNNGGSFVGASTEAADVSAAYTGYNHFEVTLSGLKTDTVYCYRVGNDTDGWSDDATFTTAGDTDHFSFAYLGDVQEGFDTWGTMIEDMYSAYPDLKFSMMGGDLINTYNSTSEWQSFLENATKVFRYIPMMSARGNHDDSDLYPDTLAFPTNGPDILAESCYSFDYGNAHFTVLDSNVFSNSTKESKQCAWLTKDLANTDKEWKFVVFHEPIYGTFTDTSNSYLSKSLLTILENGGVDAVFTAHQQEYMRSKPIKGDEIQDDGFGIVYFMGNSGTKYYAPGPGFDYIAAEVAYVSNYQIIHIDGDTFELVSKNADGEEIDSYSFQKRTQYDITVNGLSGGSVMPSRMQAPQGDTVSLTITPDSGKELSGGSLKVSYYKDGVTQYVPLTKEKDNLYTFVMSAYAVNIEAEFTEIVSYAVVIDGSITGGTVSSDKYNAEAGDTVTLTVIPGAGKQLKSGTLNVSYDDGGTVKYAVLTPGAKNTYTFIMPACAVQVSVCFIPYYTVTPGSDDAYSGRIDSSRIAEMTVNSGFSGMTYFEAVITPLGMNHSGAETVIFAHYRNGAQLSINATVADFDVVNTATAEAGFNVQAGDVVKVYIVDTLTNSLTVNPVSLQ